MSAAGGGGGDAAPVPLPTRSAAGVGSQGLGPACRGLPGFGFGAARPGAGDGVPEAPGLRVSLFGALASWGPSSPDP